MQVGLEMFFQHALANPDRPLRNPIRRQMAAKAYNQTLLWAIIHTLLESRTFHRGVMQFSSHEILLPSRNLGQIGKMHAAALSCVVQELSSHEFRCHTSRELLLGASGTVAATAFVTSGCLPVRESVHLWCNSS